MHAARPADLGRFKLRLDFRLARLGWDTATIYRIVREETHRCKQEFPQQERYPKLVEFEAARR